MPCDRLDAVAVIMYHSVGRVMTDWKWSLLTVPWRTFEDHLRSLSSAGYRSATLGELHDHVSGQRPLGGKRVILTFDDGYLDNWTYAAPLMRKYGFAGTVCVTTEFVDSRAVVRPTLEDAWAGRAGADELPVRGFMSWEELKRASDEGVLSVQSHAITHTWYPVGDTVVDFHHPGDGHYWLDWNAEPADKPFYLERLGKSLVAWGTPVYEHAKSLECRRFEPDPGETERLVDVVKRGGGGAFFADPLWRDRLARALSEYRGGRVGGGGTTEPDAAMRERVRCEIGESKRLIESRLGRPVEHLFWPGGGYSDEALEYALSIYRSVTWSKRDRWGLWNLPGEDPTKVSRRGVPFVDLGGCRVHTNGRYLLWFLDEYRGSALARKKRQALKLALMGLRRLGMWPWRRDELIRLRG